MLLRRLIFNDYRLFKGIKIIDLSIDYSSDKNIILIGGKNGAGKTSILEGIRLALYGQEAWLHDNQSYEQFIRESINKRSFREGKRSFSIEVEFEREAIGLSTLGITREWILYNDGTLKHERLSVLENGNKKEELEDEQDKADFINALIPNGVSQFFFFDGEKIQDMADDEGHESKLIDSIKDILNINIYSRLEDDLIYYERQLKTEQITKKDSELIQARADLAKYREDLETCEAIIKEKYKELEEVDKDIEGLKKWLRRQGITSSENRLDIQEQIEELYKEQENLQDQLANFINDKLPYLIIGANIRELFQQIEKEQEIKERLLKSSDLKNKANQLIIILKDDEIRPPLTDEQFDILSKRIIAIYEDEIETDITEADIIHDLSKHDIESLKETLGEIIKGNYSDIERLIKTYDDTVYDINSLRQTLKKIPSNDIIRSEENKLDKLQQTKGRVDKEIESEKFRIDNLNDQIKSADTAVNNLLDKVNLTKKIQKKIDISKQIREVLSEFISELTAEKAKDVQFYLTEMFCKLIRKNDLVKEFKINPDTFEVTFQNIYGEYLPKKRLSAGEKALYAISLVWAFSQASQHPLPIVIDTPFGRLDTEHRTNILNNYLPYANRQVVILSTDTEVVGEWRNMVKDYIAKEYILLQDGEETTIEQGYFG